MDGSLAVEVRLANTAFSGEALYAGADMGKVEAVLASGQETAQTNTIGSPATPPVR
jgi:hypothetical protein